MLRSVEINYSISSRFPLPPPTYILEKAVKGVGCEGLEILPTRLVLKELEKGSLTADPQSVKSIHQDWRRDERAEKEYKLHADTNVDIKSKVTNYIVRHLVFPPEKKCATAVKKLQEIYDVPMVHHWPDDSSMFKKPSLEIHPYFPKSMPPEKLIEWTQQDPQNRSLTLTISQRKLGDYLARQNISTGELPNVIANLTPYLGEVHFQVASKSEFNEVRNQIKDGNLGKTVELLKNNLFKGPYVLEIKGGSFIICSKAVKLINSIYRKIF